MLAELRNLQIEGLIKAFLQTDSNSKHDYLLLPSPLSWRSQVPVWGGIGTNRALPSQQHPCQPWLLVQGGSSDAPAANGCDQDVALPLLLPPYKVAPWGKGGVGAVDRFGHLCRYESLVHALLPAFLRLSCVISLDERHCLVWFIHSITLLSTHTLSFMGAEEQNKHLSGTKVKHNVKTTEIR